MSPTASPAIAPSPTPDSSAATADLDASLARWAPRGIVLASTVAAAVAGFWVTDPAATARAVAEAGDDFARLLRGMAALKSLMAAVVLAAVVWRLGVPASRSRVAIYALACGAMAAGPGLIWGMVHLRWGAVLLHGGLLVGLVVVWRDPAVAARLSAMLDARRQSAGRRQDAGHAGP